jgi:hypothetical protein
MKEYFAYIDESGDPDFNEKASKYFFVCAILLLKENQNDLLKTIDEIKKRYGLVELKSNKIDSYSKRYEICQRIIENDISIISVLVEKDKVSGGWIKSRKNFYKYIQGVLNHQIYQVFGAVETSIDKFGSLEYQASFKRYLDATLQGELFDPQISIESAKSNEFIQVSDFLAGSIKKSLSDDFDDKEQMLELIKPKWKVRIKIPEKNKQVIEIIEYQKMVWKFVYKKQIDT